MLVRGVAGAVQLLKCITLWLSGFASPQPCCSRAAPASQLPGMTCTCGTHILCILLDQWQPPVLPGLDPPGCGPPCTAVAAEPPIPHLPLELQHTVNKHTSKYVISSRTCRCGLPTCRGAHHKHMWPPIKTLNPQPAKRFGKPPNHPIKYS